MIDFWTGILLVPIFLDMDGLVTRSCPPKFPTYIFLFCGWLILHDESWFTMENQPAAKKEVYVGNFGGHEHACHPSISNQIGTSRIPMIKSIILKGQNRVLSYPGVGLRGKYLKNEKKLKKSRKKKVMLGCFWAWTCIPSIHIQPNRYQSNPHDKIYHFKGSKHGFNLS